MAKKSSRKDQWTRREMLALTGAAGLASFGMAAHRCAALPSLYHQKVLAKHPVAYWRLGESGGSTAVDETKHGNDGTYQGDPTYREAGAIRCDQNTAVKLDGQRSYVEVSDSASFSQPTSGQGLTVEVWVRPDALVFAGETTDPHIHWLGKGVAGQHEWAFRFYSKESTRPNRISAYIWSPSGGLGAGAYFQDTLEPGKWIHVVACYDPGDANDPEAGVSIYKNGVLRGGPATQPGALYRAYNIAPAHGAAALRFGTRDLNSFLTGGLDEIAIYPRVLTAAEVLDNYKAGGAC
ncbi:MAG TPA: LamG domain-containing protein [Blastocatellia bacterium]|nr:LamG domain-containing protein [Blastocatellia bacterium]